MKLSRAQFLLTLTVLLLASCGEKPEAWLNEHTRMFWNAVFRGNMQSAYAMLTSQSKAGNDLAEFSQRINFYPFPGELPKDFREAFAQRCRVSILAVEVKRNRAEVQVILSIPYLEELKLNLETENSQNADTTWIIQRMREALITGQVPSRELRVKVTWVKEEENWKIALD